MSYTYKVFTRYNNEELFQMMRSFMPSDVEIVKGEDFNDWTQASDYLHWVLEQDVDFAINVDLDCFIFDWPEVINLMDFMWLRGFTHCGIPDGGVLAGRELSWAVMNPHFNIFNVRDIRKIIDKVGMSREMIDQHPFLPHWEELRPKMINEKYTIGMHEPFDGLFHFLYRYGRPLLLNGKNEFMDKDPEDITNTIYGLNGRFAYHTWYSREFNYSDYHKRRIIRCYMAAKESQLYSQINHQGYKHLMQAVGVQVKKALFGTEGSLFEKIKKAN
jgi:hypothetical protein